MGEAGGGEGLKTACSSGIQGREGAGQVCRAPGRKGRSNSWRLGAATLACLATYVSIGFP